MKAHELDAWLPSPSVRISHRRTSAAPADRLWTASRAVRLSDTRMLGRVVRWRIPGTRAAISFDEMFRNQPFLVLEAREAALVSGLVGRIWTFRRDYPELGDQQEYLRWSQSGTAKVMFANWVEPARSGGSVLHSETRVQVFGIQGRIGLASIRPLIRGFQQLIWSDAMAVAVRTAERP